MAFDGMLGQTISLVWQSEPSAALTIEYWANVLDTHMSQQALFAYSVFSVTGRYSSGAPIYENANEL
jgi:hypothetical protein